MTLKIVRLSCRFNHLQRNTMLYISFYLRRTLIRFTFHPLKPTGWFMLYYSIRPNMQLELRGSMKYLWLCVDQCMQWRAEGGTDGATAPGIHPGGHPVGQFSLKSR